MRAIIAIALCAAVAMMMGTADAAADAPSTLPTRPPLPSQGRFPHAIIDINAAAANTGRGARNDGTVGSSTAAGLVRRFQHQMIVDLAGRDVTAEWDIPPRDNDASRTFADDTLAPLGLSLLQYDVEMSPNARVLDEDYNVRAVECTTVAGAPGMLSTHTLDLTVEDVTAALALYGPGSVVQGSPMWGCTNLENREDPHTILMSVATQATKVDEHTVRIMGPSATYQQLFGEAHVLLRQPSLMPTHAGDAESAAAAPPSEHPLAKPGSQHPMAVGPTVVGKLVASAPTSSGDDNDVSPTGRKLLDTTLTNPWAVSNEWAQQGVATYSRSCADVPCNQPATSLSKWQQSLCKLCSQGRDMSFSVACSDCAVRYAAQVTLFAFSYSLNPFDLYVRGEVRMEASFATDLDVTAGITFTQRVAGTLNLIAPVAIPPSVGVSIGPVSVTIGASFALDAGYAVDFTARASLRAQAAVSNTVTAVAIYDTRNNPDASLVGNIPPWSITQQPTVEVKATGELTLTLALTPILSIGITRMVEAKVQTDVAVVAHANFSWPAFPLIAAPSLWDANAAHPALWHYGNCETPHLVRYDISAGIVNGYANASVVQSIGGAISGLLSGLDKTVEIARVPLPELRVPLLSGCLLKQSSSDPIILVFNLPPGRNTSFDLRMDLPNLNYNLVADLASALNVSASRFLVELLDQAGQVVDRDALVRALYEQLLPAQTTLALGHMRRDATTVVGSIAPDGSNVAAARVVVLQSDNPSDESPSEIQSRVAAQMSNPSSPLRQNSAVVSKLELSSGGASSSGGLSGGAIAGIVIGVVLGLGLVSLALWFALVHRRKQERTVTSSSAAKGSAGSQQAKEAIPQGLVAMQSVKLHASAESPQCLTSNPAISGGTQLAEVHLSIRPSAPPAPVQTAASAVPPPPPVARAAPPPPVAAPAPASTPLHLRMTPTPPPPPATSPTASSVSKAPLSPRGAPPPPPSAAAAAAPASRPMTVAERMAAFEKPQIE